jgi:hypothetical protein
MPGFMDKVKQAAEGVAEVTKKGAATAQTKAKIHGLRGKADEAAQKLGYLVHRERVGGEAAGVEADALVTEITDLQAQIAELEAAGEESGLSEPEAAGEESGSSAPEAESGETETKAE